MDLSPEELRLRWLDFKVHKLPESRVDLINHYSYLVKTTARRLVGSLPDGLDLEDLIGAGVIGLIKAVDQFDPTRDVRFETYAIAMIRGAILEMLRDEDWVPRSIREKLKAFDRTMMSLETKYNRAPSEQEIADAMGTSVTEIHELTLRVGNAGTLSLDNVLRDTDSDDHINLVELVVDERSSVSREVDGREIRRLLTVDMNKLPESERMVVALYYFEGLTFKEIGKILGVTEPRVYELHTEALARLRKVGSPLNRVPVEVRQIMPKSTTSPSPDRSTTGVESTYGQFQVSGAEEDRYSMLPRPIPSFCSNESEVGQDIPVTIFVPNGTAQDHLAIKQAVFQFLRAFGLEESR